MGEDNGVVGKVEDADAGVVSDHDRVCALLGSIHDQCVRVLVHESLAVVVFSGVVSH